MVAGNRELVVTAIVAFPDSLPQAGCDVLLVSMGVESPAKLLAITPPSANGAWHTRIDRRPHWSHMAVIELELARTLWEPGGPSQALDLLDPVSRQPIASGTTVSVIQRQVPVTPGLTVWLTGLSGAGKTTIARELGQSLDGVCRVETVDGDIVRTHICKGLGFTEEDRRENVRRLAYLARTFAATGAVAIVSAISPYRTMRDEARRIVGRFIEVYVNAPLSVCEDRDVKGLYEKARRGEIRSFTGIDDPYEPPLAPEVECCTDLETVVGSAAKIHAAVLLQLDEGRFTATSEGDHFAG